MEHLFNGNFEYAPHTMRSRNHSVCHLEVLKQGEAALVIATELSDNPGMSITNSSEQLATAVVNKFKLNPEKMVLIERYNDEISYGVSTGLALPHNRDTKHDNYSRATYTWGYEVYHETWVASKAQWTHITAEEVERLRSFETSKPKITLDLSGPDGNIFFVIMHAGKALREAGQADQVDAMRTAATSTHSYKDALAAIGQYVEVVDLSASE